MDGIEGQGSTEHEVVSPDVDNLKNKVLQKKPPNRQRFEKSFHEIKQLISAKEREIQVVSSFCTESPQKRIQELRNSRETINQRRRSVSSQLETLNQQINNKRDATAQLRSKLQYQTEAQIDQIVRRLESQLQQHSFRLAEERRLVAEIDKLRRSKKAVKQYNDSKDELQQLRDKQQSLREDRDSLSKELMCLRTQEDNLHTEIRKNREAADALKNELDELYDKKRRLITEFKAEQALYLQCRNQRRMEINKQRAQEKLGLAQSRAQDREEIQRSIEPYQEECHLCKTLLSFLTKLDASTPFTTPATPLSCNSSMCNTPMTPDESFCRTSGSRDDSEDVLPSDVCSLYLGITRKPSRKVKRSNSRPGLNKKRLVPLTPDILVQFASLDITAPTCLAEVPAAIESLKAKQKLFTCMANAELKKKNNSNECHSVTKQLPTSDMEGTQLSETSKQLSETRKLSSRSLSLDLSVSSPFSSTSLQCSKDPNLMNGVSSSPPD